MRAWSRVSQMCREFLFGSETDTTKLALRNIKRFQVRISFRMFEGSGFLWVIKFDKFWIEEFRVRYPIILPIVPTGFRVFHDIRYDIPALIVKIPKCFSRPLFI